MTSEVEQRLGLCGCRCFDKPSHDGMIAAQHYLVGLALYPGERVGERRIER